MRITEQLKRQERQRRYNASAKGKSRTARYEETSKAQARKKRYEDAHPERKERWSPLMHIKARRN